MTPADYLRFIWSIAWLPGCVIGVAVISQTPLWTAYWGRVDERREG